MSPVPIIDRQRALARAGELHAGDEKQNGRVGQKLKTWRATTQQRDLAERFAGSFGGEVKPWEGPSGSAWQVISEMEALPVLVMPQHSLRLTYEKWEGASKRTRVCDGMEEMVSGLPCICNAEDKDECQITVRLMVLLPDTGSALGWQILSKGETAARELPLAMEMGSQLAPGSVFVPAVVRLTWRRGQRDGHATQFVVPVVDYNPRQLGQSALAPSDQRALPSGYTPIERTGNGVSLADGLAAAETQVQTRSARSAAPIPGADDIPFGDGPVPVPAEDPGAAPSLGAAPSTTAKGGPAAAPGNSVARSTQEKPLTKAQQTKLGVLVRELRDDKKLLSTDQLVSGVARNRGTDVATMLGVLMLRLEDDEGVTHFGPLMQTLTRAEASQLIDQLEAYAAKAAEQSLAVREGAA